MNSIQPIDIGKGDKNIVSTIVSTKTEPNVDSFENPKNKNGDKQLYKYDKNTRHAQFIKGFIAEPNSPFKSRTVYSPRTYLRPVDFVKQSDKIIGSYTKVTYMEDKYLVPVVKFHAEIAAFLFHVDGCAKNLLLYIITQKLNDQGQFKFNALVVHQFKEYCLSIFKTEYKEITIKQTLRNLVEKWNAVCNVHRGLYVINPLIVGGSNQAEHRALLYQYSNLLMKKKRSTPMDIYPMYEKHKGGG